MKTIQFRDGVEATKDWVRGAKKLAWRVREKEKGRGYAGWEWEREGNQGGVGKAAVVE